MSKHPPPAPTASAIDPCPTIIQICRTPRHWKFTQHLRSTRPSPLSLRSKILPSHSLKELGPPSKHLRTHKSCLLLDKWQKMSVYPYTNSTKSTNIIRHRQLSSREEGDISNFSLSTDMSISDTFANKLDKGEN